MNVVDGFQAVFGTLPSAQGRAPGRVNLIGEHIDYNGGTVLPAGIARYVEVAFAPNDEARWRISSSRFEEVVQRPLNDPAGGGWSDYAVGALAQARDMGWVTGGADIYVQSDVPDGAGVSSSAALITAILRAAMAHAGEAMAPVDLARKARQVENQYIGVPCGIMDQMAVGLVDFGEALALDTKKEQWTVLQIPEDWTFIVLHSGIRRALSDGRYQLRFEECAAAKAALGVEDLCLLDDAASARLCDLPEGLGRRVRHVVNEHARTLSAIDAMKAGDLAAFGHLMQASHRSYSEDFEASTPQIDALVDDAHRLGAKGARLTGGGFGGCIVALLTTDEAQAWVNEMERRHRATWRVS